MVTKISTTGETAHRRYAVLDGLRGVAAIAVVVFHTSYLRYAPPDVLHSAYLAVDCFFIMSGFVLCLAYHRLLEAGRVWTFMRKRWARLVPVWWVGLGLCAVELVMIKFAPGLPQSLAELAVNVTMLPWPFDPGGALFRLNMPGWSLFYELVVNLVYALIGYRLGLRGSAAVMMVSAGVLIATTSAVGATNGGLIWSEAPVALSRVCYGFVAGAVLYRLGPRLPMIGTNGGASLAVCAVVLAVFAIDLTGSPRWYFDLAATLVVLPLVVAVATRIDAPSALRPVFDALGKLSYPLYAIHWPVFVIAHQIYGRASSFAPMPVALAAALVIALTIVAYFVGVVMDPIAGRLGRALAPDRSVRGGSA